MNMVTQLVYDPNEIPHTQFSLVRCRGLCGQHGGIQTMSFAEANDNTPSVNIENSTCATSLSSHHGAGLQRCARSRFWWVSFIFSVSFWNLEQCTVTLSLCIVWTTAARTLWQL